MRLPELGANPGREGPAASLFGQGELEALVGALPQVRRGEDRR